MEPEGPLLCSLEPNTVTYPGTVESSPQFLTLLT
jgi:hypothetical protein